MYVCMCFYPEQLILIMIFLCMWVKDEKGFKHKNNKCNTALIVVVFPPKMKKFSV